ncbi:MBL fold metallo-hydrolase [Paenibacillus tarimensis]
MKLTKISENIWSLKTWLIIPIHVWVVVEEDGVTLVDAGISAMAGGIMKFIEGLQAGPLKQIVLTHGHSDHVGALKSIRAHSEVPVYAHRIEIPYMQGELPYPGRKKAAQSVEPGTVLPLPEDEQGHPLAIAGLMPYHTPGHSPGHVVYYHEKDNVLLAGDLFTSKRGRLHFPMAMFTSNMEEAISSSRIVTQLNPVRLEVCHGDSVLEPASQMGDYIKKAAQKYSNIPMQL